MTYQNLQFTQTDNILTVTVTRPKALNALNAQTISELHHFFGTELPERNDLRGVILTGAGEKSFVAGADIKEFLQVEGDQGKELSQRGQEAFFFIERAKVPVLALVNGFALGGGCELAMACHLRIATPNAKFGQPEVNLGIIAGYGGTQRLVQYIGRTKATELLLTGDMIGAEEALSLGLVNYVLPAEEATERAHKLLGKIATKGPVAVAKTIAAINAYFQDGTDGFDFEVNAFGDVTQTGDFREGAQAFVEKRRANFTGK